MSFRQPIVWLDVAGKQVAPDTLQANPFMDVDFATAPTGPWFRTLALIDSGATGSLIASAILKQVNPEALNETTAFSHHGQTAEMTYRLYIKSPAHPTKAAGVAAMEARLLSPTFKPGLILGVDFLRIGRLVLAPLGASDSYFELEP